MNDFIALKANEDQLEEYSQILDRAGIYRGEAKGREAIYFSKIDGDTFISNGFNRTKKVNTWKEFVTELLKHFTISFPSEEESKYIAKHFQANNKNCHYFGYSRWHEKFDFWRDRPTPTAISFKSFKILVDSMDAENKLTKKYNLELSGEELFYLKSLVGATSHAKEVEIISKSGKCNFVNFLKNEKPKLGRQVFLVLNNVSSINDTDFCPKSPEFKFENGLSATWIDEKIIKIGCKSKTKFAWISDCESFLKLGLDLAVIDGYSFKKSEVESFMIWLKEL